MATTFDDELADLNPDDFPEKPEKDILLFLIRHAPHLLPWQRDILEIVRLEMLYLVPQMQTKVMNEGWASIWHSRIMRQLGERGIISDSEVIEFAQLLNVEIKVLVVCVVIGMGHLDKGDAGLQ